MDLQRETLKAVILCIFLAGVALLYACVILLLNLIDFQGKFNFIDLAISNSRAKLLMANLRECSFNLHHLGMPVSLVPALMAAE